MKCDDLVFDGACIVLVGDSMQLPHVKTDSLLVKYLPSLNINDRHSLHVYLYFNNTAVLKENN